MSDTETLDKLYLEWSQFTKATTARELHLQSVIEDLLEDIPGHYRSAVRARKALGQKEAGDE